MPDCRAAAYNLIDKNLALWREEELLLGLDAGKERLARALESVCAERGQHYAELLEAAREVIVRSGGDAELHFTVADQRAFAETGLYHQAGQVGNLPAGEAACGIDDGNDVTFGGSNAVAYHADGVITAPELYLDGALVALP